MVNPQVIIAEEQYLRNQRVNRDNLLQDVGDLVMPSGGDITRTPTEGEDKSWYRYDSTAVKANKKRASSLQGILANPETKWIEIDIPTMEIDPSSNLASYLQKASSKFREVLKNPKTRFYKELDSNLIDDGGYGISAATVQKSNRYIVNFKSYHYKEFVFARDDEGSLSRFFLTFKLTLTQAVEKFGLNNLSKKLKDRYKDGLKRFEEVEFIHAVFPRPNRDPSKAKEDKRQRRFVGYFIEKEAMHIIDEQGYNRMPYVIYSGRERTGETYPDSPAIDVIDTIRQLNYQKYLNDEATEMAIRPPLEVDDDSVVGGETLDISSNAVNVVSSRRSSGNSIRPIFTVIDVRPNKETMLENKMEIEDAFMVQEFEAMRKDNMSATEAVINNDRQLRNAAPIISNLFSTLNELLELALEIIVDKDIEAMQAGLDERELILGSPPETFDLGDIEFKFKSPIARAMREEDFQAMQLQLQALSMLGQIDSNVVMRLDADQMFKIICKLLGVPSETLRDDAEVDAIKQQQQQAQQQAAMMDTAQQGAEIAKAAGEAQQMGAM